jgi:hypothetical protein
MIATADRECIVRWFEEAQPACGIDSEPGGVGVLGDGDCLT